MGQTSVSFIAGTGTSVNIGNQDWNNPGNITADDNVTSVIDNFAYSTSDYLVGSNFGFNIPLSAVINGIQVNISRFGENGNANRDASLRLRKASSFVGSDLAETSVDWPTTETVASYGGGTELWGEIWTPTDINNSDFGVGLSVYNRRNKSRLASVDYIEITVYYTVVTTPILSVDPSILDFGYTANGENSSVQTYSLTGYNLDGTQVYVSPPDGFEVSLSSSGPWTSFGSTLTIPYTAPDLSDDIYVRFSPNVADIDFSGNITNLGGGVTVSQDVAVAGTSKLSYCTAGSTTQDEYINRVQIGTIDNDNSGYSLGGYGDFTNLSTELEENQTGVQLVLTFGVAYLSDDIGVWIDWNKDGDFDDADENVICQVGLNNTTETFSFDVSSNAVPGETTMRIRLKYNDADCGLSCGTTQYGEVEDYTLSINSACSVADQTVTGGGSYCAGDVGVSVGIAGSETGVTYQLYRDGLTAVGAAQAGTGSAISFGLQTVAGTYTVVAHHVAEDCDVDMSGSAIVVVNPLPTLSGVSQNETACSGSAATINLSGLVPNSTFSLDYSIDNLDQTQITGLVADVSGDASFSTSVLADGDDGKLLQITNISITDLSPNCSQSFTQSLALDVQPTTIDVNISANPTGTVCPGSTVTYTASSVNGGSNPSYQWKVNGNNVGTNSNTYSYIPEDGDQITCSMTSDATCADGESTVPVSFFSWNDDSKSLTDSDYGIDASSINDGQYLDGGVDGTKCLAPVVQNANIMLTFDGTQSELNTDGVDYQVSYRRAESNASMFTRGSSLSITAGAAFSVTYLVDTGTGSSSVSSPSFGITDLDNFHDYRFSYNPADGYGRLYVDGLQVWQSSVPTPGMPIYWTGAGDLVIGVGMDASGNQTPSLDNLLLASIQLKTVTDTFDATVGDTEKPTIICPADIFVVSQDSICGAAVSYVTPSGTDNCSAVTSTLIEGLASGDTFQVGSTVVSYEIADASGNKDTCSFTVTVSDINPPTFRTGTYPDTISVANTPGLCGKVVTFVAPTASDFCDLPTITRTSVDSSGMFFPIGSTPVTYEAIDLYGNLAFDTIYVNVYDAEAPTIDTCPEAVYSTPFDTIVDINTFIPMVANDNCSGATINYDPLTQDLSLANVEIITNIASDLYGNADTCSFVFTIQDNLPIETNPDVDTICAGTTLDYNFTDTWGSKSKWIVNGPDATISDPNSASTEITFNAPGVYTIRAKIQESGPPTFYNDFMVVEADDGSVVAEVTIAASPSASVCNGTEVTFTATPINGGATPGYKWFINEVEVSGETDPVLVRSTLTDGDLISCEMTSSLICVSNNPDTSNTITVNIDPIPTVTLESNTADACYADGTASLNYTATSGGANRYSIDYADGTIPDVNNAVLTGGNIVLAFPTDKNPGTYAGTLTVSNSVTGCVSEAYSIEIIIHELPASGEIIPD